MPPPNPEDEFVVKVLTISVGKVCVSVCVWKHAHNVFGCCFQRVGEVSLAFQMSFDMALCGFSQFHVDCMDERQSTM